MEDPRIRKFAKFLINSAVGLQKGEKILIELHGSETTLMKALVQEAYAAGGKPFIHIFDYDVEGALVAGADAEHMAEIASYELERMKDMDAYIDIRATTNISMWHNISDEAQRRYRQYYWGPIHLDQRCNHTRWSVLRYPNDAMAQLAGVSTEEYEDFYFKACLVDYDKMGRAMEHLEALMDRTDKVHIVSPGTDLTFSIKDIPCFGISSVEKKDFAAWRELGRVCKLFVRAERHEGRISAFVCPTLFPAASPVAQTNGTGNLVTLRGARFGELSFSGAGAGGYPTGSSVLSDCVDVIEGCPSFYVSRHEAKHIDNSAAVGRFYLRTGSETVCTGPITVAEAFARAERARSCGEPVFLARIEEE